MSLFNNVESAELKFSVALLNSVFCFTLPFTLFKHMNKPLYNHERLKDLGYIVLMKISLYGQYAEPLMSHSDGTLCVHTLHTNYTVFLKSGLYRSTIRLMAFGKGNWPLWAEHFMSVVSYYATFCWVHTALFSFLFPASSNHAVDSQFIRSTSVHCLSETQPKVSLSILCIEVRGIHVQGQNPSLIS